MNIKTVFFLPAQSETIVPMKRPIDAPKSIAYIIVVTELVERQLYSAFWLPRV